MIEPLLERAEQYGKTSLELIKLKSLNKTSDIVSTLVYKIIMIVAFSFFLILGSIALAIYLGTILGTNYFGFLVVSGFYALLYFVLYLSKKALKKQVKQSMVKQILN